MKKTSKDTSVDHSWSGWQPKVATDHQIKTILELSSPTDRLQWLAEMLEGLEKLGLIKHVGINSVRSTPGPRASCPQNTS